MSGTSSGVPVWVPILVGILGMCGVIGGQLLNAWREGRRWKREKEREELRWKREKEKESESNLKQDQDHWRSQRIEIYSNLLQSLKSWHLERFYLYSSMPGSPERYSASKSLEQQRLKLRENLTLVEILGSESMLQRAKEVRSWLFEFNSKIKNQAPVKDLEFSPEEISHLDKLNARQYSIILSAVREDLGIRDSSTEKTTPTEN